MDVLELPRPVINFLRNMAKEGTRYSLSWDIFGGSDTVTLTLTWNLVDESALNETNEILLPPSSSIVNRTTNPRNSSDQHRSSRRDAAEDNFRSLGRRSKSQMVEEQRSSVERPDHLSLMTNSRRSSPLSLDRSQHRTNQRPSILNRTHRSSTKETDPIKDENENENENPWVKRIETSSNKDCELTQGKVKFKSKPDYF